MPWGRGSSGGNVEVPVPQGKFLWWKRSLCCLFSFLFLPPSSSVLSMSSFLLVLNHFLFPFFNSAKKTKRKGKKSHELKVMGFFHNGHVHVKDQIWDISMFLSHFLFSPVLSLQISAHTVKKAETLRLSSFRKKQKQEPQIPSDLMMQGGSLTPPHSLPLPPAFGPAAFRCKRSRHMERRSLCCDPPKDSDCMTNHVQGCSASSILRPPTHPPTHLHPPPPPPPPPQTTASLGWKKRVFAALSSQDSQLLLPFSITPLLQRIQVIALQTIWPPLSLWALPVQANLARPLRHGWL